MQLYTPEGWLNIPAILDAGYPFCFVTGGRGTGKTYGALMEARRRSAPDHRFMLLRRTQAQLELISKQEFSPFKAVDRDNHYFTVSMPLSKYTTGFYNGQEQDNGTVRATGPVLGYGAALSVFHALRGFDASDVSLLIFDEFIPQNQERPLKDEAGALWNCYETINRNRELDGRPPLQLLALANSNVLGNPVFLDLKLVQVAERMRAKGREVWTDDKRGIMMVILQESPISAQKADTTLYRMQQGSEFARMALDNDFSYEERGATGRIPLKELVPLVAVGEICIYRRKAGGYYVTGHKSGSPDSFGTGPHELSRFRSRFLWLWQAYLRRQVIFEEYLYEVLFTKYFQ